MSTFGKIGSFIRKTAEGVVEIVSAPFVSAPPAHSTIVPAANSAVLPEAAPASAPEVISVVVQEAKAIFIQETNSVEERPSPSAPLGVAHPPPEVMAAAVGRTLSSEPYGPEFPASAVTRRYRALKAEGLTAKQASEFSHSSKKYARYRVLAATRAYDGGETYWDRLRDFDQKAEAHLQHLKQGAALKQDVKVFKADIERARDLLI